MSLTALSLVLFAALLHAGWNAMLKAVDDRAGVLAAVSASHAAVGLAMVLSFPVPAMASWPSLVASTLLHYGYYIFLFRAYRHGDLSQVYPISRGMAPALVAVSAVSLIGETLAPLGWAGLACVSLGVGILALQRGRPMPRGRSSASRWSSGCSSLPIRWPTVSASAWREACSAIWAGCSCWSFRCR